MSPLAPVSEEEKRRRQDAFEKFVHEHPEALQQRDLVVGEIRLLDDGTVVKRMSSRCVIVEAP